MLDRTEAQASGQPRILVTGAAGFIGFHVARRLLDSGATVCGLDNLCGSSDLALKSARLERLSGPAFTFVKLDLVIASEITEHMRKFRPHAVIHLAARAGVRNSLAEPDAYIASNVTGFLSILEACRRNPVRHLIYASSSSVYGSSSRLPFSEHDPADCPVSLYGATKRSNELMAHAYAHLFAIPATGLRFFTVYGPWGRPDMAYFKFTRAIAAGEPIDVYNEGRLERDFTYIDDAVAVVAALIDRPPTPGAAGGRAPHRIYNVGNRDPVRLDHFIAMIEEAVGRTAIRRMLPMQPGDVPATCADVGDLVEAVGFAPQTPINRGIRRFVRWYLCYRGLAGEPQSAPRAVAGTPLPSSLVGTTDSP